MQDASASPIFIVGSGRSGTTLLRLMLCAHPRIYICHEAAFYVWDNVYTRQGNARDFLRAYVKTFSFRWLRVDPLPVILSVGISCDRKHMRAAFTETMRLKAEQYGKPRWGDKTPNNTGSLQRIFDDYPEARVIHIVRDPRGVVASLMRMPWASGSTVANAYFYEMSRQHVEPFKDRILEIRMEDLLSQPRETMQTVLDYVGEPWDEAVLHHTEHRTDPGDMPPVDWLEGAGRERAGPKARWQDLSAAEIRLIESISRKSLQAYGYRPAVLPREPGRMAMMRLWLRDLPEALRFAGTYFRMGWQLRKGNAFESPLVKKIFSQLNRKSWVYYPNFEMPDPPALREGWEEAFNSAGTS